MNGIKAPQCWKKEELVASWMMNHEWNKSPKMLGKKGSVASWPKDFLKKSQVNIFLPRGKDDFYSNLAAMAENDVESDVSDADVGKMAKAIAVSSVSCLSCRHSLLLDQMLVYCCAFITAERILLSERAANAWIQAVELWFSSSSVKEVKAERILVQDRWWCWLVM